MINNESLNSMKSMLPRLNEIFKNSDAFGSIAALESTKSVLPRINEIFKNSDAFGSIAALESMKNSVSRIGEMMAMSFDPAALEVMKNSVSRIGEAMATSFDPAAFENMKIILPSISETLTNSSIFRDANALRNIATELSSIDDLEDCDFEQTTFDDLSAEDQQKYANAFDYVVCGDSDGLQQRYEEKREEFKKEKSPIAKLFTPPTIWELISLFLALISILPINTVQPENHQLIDNNSGIAIIGDNNTINITVNDHCSGNSRFEPKAAWTNSNAIIREEPHTSSTILSRIEVGQELTLINDVSYYYEVNFTDVETGKRFSGWISKRSISLHNPNNDKSNEETELLIIEHCCA